MTRVRHFFYFSRLLINAPTHDNEANCQLASGLFRDTGATYGVISRYLPVPIATANLPNVIVPNIRTSFIVFDHFAGSVNVNVAGLFA